MPSSFTQSLRLELQANGENDTTWGEIANRNFKQIDAAISGRVDIVMANADKSLTTSFSGDDEARAMLLVVGGTMSAPRNLVVPSVSKQYIVRNVTSGNQTLTVKTATGSGISLANGETRLLVCDGTNVLATGAGSDARVSASGIDTASQLWRVNGSFGVNRADAIENGYGIQAIDGTVGSIMRFYANGVLVGQVSGVSSGLNINAGAPIVFGINNTPRFRINANGSMDMMGDLTNSGSYTGLHGIFTGDVYGRSLKITSAAPYITFDDTDTTSDRQLVFNSGLFGFALSNGNWAAYSDDSGNWTAAGNITAYSDERKKKDWDEVDTGFLEKLAGVLSGTYTDIETGERRAGVGAQHLQEVLPETVKTCPSGTLSVAYGNAALVAAIELAKEVINLRARLAALEMKVK